MANEKKGGTVSTTDYDSIVRSGELTDAAAYNAAYPYSPHETTAGHQFTPPPGYVSDRDKTYYGLTGDWDPTRDGDNNVMTQLDGGPEVAGWEDGIITWGFYDFRTKVGPNSNGESRGYFPFTEAQKTAAQYSINTWDELIKPTFVLTEFDGHDARQWGKREAPDILMANTMTGPAQAWAYFPSSGGNGAWHRNASDVWIGASGDNYTDLFHGGYGLTTQVHELGHSLGLDHPGTYNFGDDNDGDGLPDPITYAGDAFYAQDTRQYSIMSYFDAYETGSNIVDWNLMRVINGSTPMVHDIYVIQQKYGADMTTRTGDTTYGFNWTGDVTNEAMQFTTKLERMAIFSIWDANGNDTLDLSGYYTPSVIDLREGAYSSAGGLGAYDASWVGKDPNTLTKEEYLAFVNANNTAAGLASRTAAYDLYFGGREGANEGVPWSDIVGDDWLMENNIGIAYGAVIENAIGGGGNDRINGNHATNTFTGGGGNDVFVIADYTGKTLAGADRVDSRSDVITDFTTGVDKIDLTEFEGVKRADVSQDDAGRLLIDTDGTGTLAPFVVDLQGRTINLDSDIVFG